MLYGTYNNVHEKQNENFISRDKSSSHHFYKRISFFLFENKKKN